MAMSELFRPLTSGRMSSEIVGQIVPRIRDGTIRPGDRFPSERELSETFKVSRITVRDALRTLEVMGLIEIRVGSTGGSFVTIPSTDVVGEGLVNMMALQGVEQRELIETRTLMELAILELVIERITDEEVAHLRELCDRGIELASLGEYDTKLSLEFHAELARCTHNRAMTLIARSFAGPLAMTAVRSTEDWATRATSTAREHRELVEAIADRDAPNARRILVEHLQHRNLERIQEASRDRASLSAAPIVS
jgi:DNA-binding FadR family transcriptional regulator